MSEITAQQELDCRGMTCPAPLLKTKKTLGTLASGEVLKVIASDPGSVSDMASFSAHTGHEIIDQSEGNGEYIFFFRKS